MIIASILFFVGMTVVAVLLCRHRLSMLGVTHFGTLPKGSSGFSSRTGWSVTREYLNWDDRHPRIVENYTVSIAVSKQVRIKMWVKVPAAIRHEVLNGYSDALAKTILGGYFSFPFFSVRPDWPRPLAQALAVELSALVTNCGRGVLETRDGRMVYRWTQLEPEDSSMRYRTAMRAQQHLKNVVRILAQEPVSNPESSIQRSDQ